MNQHLCLQLVWPAARTFGERVAALRIFLESLVHNLRLPGDHNIASFVHWALLTNRYAHIGPDPDPQGTCSRVVDGCLLAAVCSCWFIRSFFHARVP